MRKGVVAVIAAAALGCSTSSSNPPTLASCPSVVVALCKAACACGATDVASSCAVGTSVDGAGGGALGWASAAACEAYFSSACADTGPGVGLDVMACSNALALSSCVTTVNGPALLFPSSCVARSPDAGADSGR